MKRAICITVGSSGAMVTGADDRAVQAAIELAAAHGGGTVELLAGVYALRGAVRLRSNIRLVGAGETTVLVKSPSVTVPLADDTDWYEWRVTVADASPFSAGDDILLQGKCPHSGRPLVTKHTVTAKDGTTLWLDRQPRQNFWTDGEATVSSLFPLVTADNAADIGVANLVLDGNRPESGYLDGNYGAAIFLQDCERVAIDGIVARNMESDGLSFQIVHDLAVENSTFADLRGNGIHPGSGSQRPVIRRNTVRRCGCGIGWCWGVKYGFAEENLIEECGTGISIGHRDTDNVMRRNTVRSSGRCGLFFREDPPARAAHRNLIEENVFENAGTAAAPGYLVDLAGPVDSVAIRKNAFVSTRPGTLKAAVRIGPAVTKLLLDANEFRNVERPVEDLRPAAG